MPRTPDLSSYGTEYEQLVLRADAELAKGIDEYTVQFDSPNMANSIRTRAYGYFKAIRNSATRPDLAAISTGLSMRIAGSALVFFRRENAADAVAIRAALGLAEGFADGHETTGVIAPNSGLSSHLEKLEAIRSRKKQ